jgi:hypothetical protein
LKQNKGRQLQQQQTTVADRNNQKQGSENQDLAWLPDLSEAIGSGADFWRLNHFRPIEQEQRDFVHSDGIRQQLVVGARGMGKSTLLLYRMNHLSSLPKQFRCVRRVPPFGFRLVNQSVLIPPEALALYSRVDSWSAVWRVVLGLYFAYSMGREAPFALQADNIQEWFKLFALKEEDFLLRRLMTDIQIWGMGPFEERTHHLIQAIVDSRASPSFLESMFEQKIAPILRRGIAHAPTDVRWVISVDCIDEALTVARGAKGLLAPEVVATYVDTVTRIENDTNPSKQSTNTDNIRLLVHELWANAQIGYGLIASRLIKEFSGRLVAFGGFRSEVAERFVLTSGLTKTKVDELLLRLKPDDDWLREIFIYNVNLTQDRDKNKIVSSSLAKKDPEQVACESLSGLPVIPNRTVFGKAESTFNLLRRHNFGAPRGLMSLGRAFRKIPLKIDPTISNSPVRDPVRAIHAVNVEAVEVFKEYRDTLFPPWDADYERGFPLIQTNLLSKTEVERINVQFDNLCKKAKPFLEYLMNIGLIGIPQYGERGIVQKFWMPGDEPMKLPSDLEYAVLHPAFSAYLTQTRNASSQRKYYSSAFFADPNAPCDLTIPDPFLSLDFMKNGLGAKVICQSIRPNTGIVFEGASNVGSAFLLVLLVAQKFFEKGEPLYFEQLSSVGEALETLGFIPNALGHAKTRRDGMARKSVSEFFRGICDNAVHPNQARQATSITDANTLLSKSGEFKVLGQYGKNGNGYFVGEVNSESRTGLAPGLIDIIGLSSIDFFKAMKR